MQAAIAEAGDSTYSPDLDEEYPHQHLDTMSASVIDMRTLIPAREREMRRNEDREGEMDGERWVETQRGALPSEGGVRMRPFSTLQREKSAVREKSDRNEAINRFLF